MADQDQLITLTADIVSAHVGNNNVAIGDVATLVEKVHAALTALGASPAAPEPEAKVPAVSVRASVKPDYLVCLECGKKQKTLRRHLQTAHGLTPEQYRNEYGLPKSYPMTSSAYSTSRREMAKSIGLGRKARAEATPTPGEEVTQAPRPRRARKPEAAAPAGDGESAPKARRGRKPKGS